jgi:hypothetical protein
MKISKTTKLFYGKWPYKVSVHTRGAHLIRFYGADILIRRFDDSNDNFRYHGLKPHDLKDLEKCARGVLKLKSIPNIKYRYEGGTINLFTDTMEVFNVICNTFLSKIVQVWQPSNDSEIQHLKNNINHIIVDVLPYNKYKYKILLKYNTPAAIRESVVKWLENNPGSTRPSNATKRFLNCRSYIQSPFIYIEDDKTLMMLQLIAGEQIKKTEKYIIRTDINNTK